MSVKLSKQKADKTSNKLVLSAPAQAPALYQRTLTGSGSSFGSNFTSIIFLHFLHFT